MRRARDCQTGEVLWHGTQGGLLERRARDPVLFVHPWELVDMSGTGIRLDCRFNTGEPALANLSAIIRWLKETGYRFLTVSEFASQTTRAG